MSKFISIFIRTGGFFGLAMGVYLWIVTKNLLLAAEMAIVMGAFFGGSIAIFSVLFDPEAGVITANIPWSWRSFGEKIQVSVKEASPLEALVEVNSRPRWPLTLADYGRNFENVETICEHLTTPTGPGTLHSHRPAA